MYALNPTMTSLSARASEAAKGKYLASPGPIPTRCIFLGFPEACSLTSSPYGVVSCYFASKFLRATATVARSVFFLVTSNSLAPAVNKAEGSATPQTPTSP